MKLEYLKGGSDDCPLIRLYEFQSAEIRRLWEAFEGLANGTSEHVVLDHITPIESVDGTSLSFTRTIRDKGVVQSGPQSFEVALTPAGWDRCAGLLEPFCEPSSGYQWLCDDVGRIRLLISHDGSW